MVKEISGITVERRALAGFMKKPQKLLELVHLVSSSDFLGECHAAIFEVVKDHALNNKSCEPFIIAERLKANGISYKAGLDILSYLESIVVSKPSDKAVDEACRLIKTYSIRREICNIGDEMKRLASDTIEEDANKIIAETDKIYAEKMTSFGLEVKGEDMFDGIVEYIEELAATPMDEVGFKTPYPNFNKIYGGLRNGEVYAWVSRPGVGKSTLLNDIALGACILNPGLKVLILDTEMQTIPMRLRIASAVTGIPLWWLETGNYIKNKELKAKFDANKEKLKSYTGMVTHLHVAGKPVEEICSIIQRWYYSQVGRGNPAAVVYDYIKLTGESDYNKKEYELIGEKVNSLKECITRLNIPLLTSCQLNRSAESGNDDSSAIAQSDRLQWFAGFVWIFRRKTLEEQAEDGKEFGTHKMIELKSRFQGKDAAGHSNSIRVVDAKGKVTYKSNFINFNVENFAVTEKGTLNEIVNSKGVSVDVFEETEKDNLL
jgi:replicative DNA helicase